MKTTTQQKKTERINIIMSDFGLNRSEAIEYINIIEGMN